MNEASRRRRLFGGWSASFVQMALGLVQQVVLIPVFLHYWTEDILAAWLAIYAAGMLALVVDAGLQVLSINRFLGFKSRVDCDRRTARFCSAMLRAYLGLVAVLTVPLLVGPMLLPPSVMFGFQTVSHFDAAFVVVAIGTLWSVPSNLAAGLYRARGYSGRAVGVQNAATAAGQLGQFVAIVTTGSLLAVAVVYAAAQVLGAAYLLLIDARRLFPLVSRARAIPSWRWIMGQFRQAAPFAVAGAADLGLLNLPVLLVSAFVSDRAAVVQWGLTRVVAGLLRALCVLTTLPLASELGHDYAVGARQQLRDLYARGSVLVALLASLAVSGLLPFWPDFFTLWTHGAIAYDPLLTVTLLIGTAAGAPAVLAFAYANYSNRGRLLVRAKGIQLAVFLVLSLILIPWMGPLGAAIAVVVSDLSIQCGVLAFVILRQTLKHPFRHVLFLAAMMISVTLSGWGAGIAIRMAIPWTGLAGFVAECSAWLLVVALMASPLTIARVRERLIAAIPR